ncbi:MAG: hypothetical protein ACKPKO_07570, partial [Candidatus Fonsibacter sp.]
VKRFPLSTPLYTCSSTVLSNDTMSHLAYTLTIDHRFEILCSYKLYAYNSSKSLWSLVNVQAKCDIVSLDNSVEEEFYKCTLSGKPFINQL